MYARQPIIELVLLQPLQDQEDFEGIRVKVKKVTMAVRNEDQKRNLQSLLPAMTEKVKYPSFSGESGEDLTD